jgi:hypothetical protein
VTALEQILVFLSDPAVRPEPVRYLTEILRRACRPYAVKPLVSGLKHQNSDVRQAVAEALGKIADPQAIEPLAASIQDPNSEVRQAVIVALGRIENPRAVEILVGKLSSDDQAVRVGAFKSLLQGCDPIDRRLLTQNFNAIEPFLDPQTVIGQQRVHQAVKTLNMRERTVRRRYEALAQRFGLNLAWQASHTAKTTNPQR